MSVNVHVNVRRCMAVDDCLQWSVHVSVNVVSVSVSRRALNTYLHTYLSLIHI